MGSTKLASLFPFLHQEYAVFSMILRQIHAFTIGGFTTSLFVQNNVIHSLRKDLLCASFVCHSRNPSLVCPERLVGFSHPTTSHPAHAVLSLPSDVPRTPVRPSLHNSGRKNLELFARSMGDISHLPGPWAHDLIPWTAVVKSSCCAPSVRDPRSKLGLLRCDFFSELGDPDTVLKCAV